MSSSWQPAAAVLNNLREVRFVNPASGLRSLTVVLLNLSVVRFVNPASGLRSPTVVRLKSRVVSVANLGNAVIASSRSRRVILLPITCKQFSKSINFCLSLSTLAVRIIVNSALRCARLALPAVSTITSRQLCSHNLGINSSK